MMPANILTGRPLGPTLQFGIPSLDELLGQPKGGAGSGYGDELDRFTSMCLVGPDGTGKSVLALHLASSYAARTFAGAAPSIFYASTDLSFHKAQEVWNHFGLHQPADRNKLFGGSGVPLHGDEIKLQHCGPTSPSQPGCRPLSDVVAAGCMGSIAFLDLESMTGGDDWSLLTDLLAMLKPPVAGPLHLLVIDAVEGLQTLGGDRDAYGETRTRRSRIEPIIRAAHGTAHIVLVLEEPTGDFRFEEQFVTDAVLRLRTTEAHSYSARTVEVEKARGQTHARGQHSFTIRSGGGSTTGMQQNIDDRRVDLGDSPVSYIQVFHSLDFLDSKQRADRTPGKTDRLKDSCRSFNIHYLDEMLGRDEAGVPAGSITSIVGDIGTHKSHLARGFLSSCVEEFVKRQGSVIRGKEVTDAMASFQEADIAFNGLTQSDLDQPGGAEAVMSGLHAAYERLMNLLRRRVAAKARRLKEPAGVAVLITTDDLSSTTLAGRLYEWLSEETVDRTAAADQPLLRKLIESRVICRRLEAHTVSPALLMHVVRETVGEAKRIIGEGLGPDHTMDEKRRAAHRIHFVMDDWDVMARMYPAVTEDPKFLEFLKRYLEREGVTSVLTESRSSMHQYLLNDGGSSIGRLSDRKLHTWHVPFYGRRIIAISPVPSLSDSQRSEVRQLRLEASGGDRLLVDPLLDLFGGLATGEPHPIQLRVRLFIETPQGERYVAQMTDLFAELYPPLEDARPVVTGTRAPVAENRRRRYDQLREFCYLQTGHLDHTVVVQVDDFWVMDGSRRGLGTQERYLTAPTQPRNTNERTFVDPYSLFQPTGAARSGEAAPSPPTRWSCFDCSAYDQKMMKGDRVPYTWDFGFMLCRYDAWRRAQFMTLKAYEKASGKSVRVGHVWNSMSNSPSLPLGRVPPALEEGTLNSWRVFFEACKIVASHRAAQEQPRSYFDLSARTGQSLICLVLEVWASEIGQSIRRERRRSKKRNLSPYERMLDQVCGVRRGGMDSQAMALNHWLTGPSLAPVQHVGQENSPQTGFAFELYLALLLLFDALDIGRLIDGTPDSATVTREADLTAVAARHWYKTASIEMEKFNEEDAIVPMGLPGGASVRGDWFLAIATGSRSLRLGERAIDLLSSRRSNLLRLRTGVGLPTRSDIVPPHALDGLDTALFTLDEVEWKLDSGAPATEDGEANETDHYRAARRRTVSYGRLRGMGEAEGRRWLWRSNFSHYDRQARVFESWISRLFRYWQQVRQERGDNWKDSFSVYDDLTSAGAPGAGGPFKGSSLETFGNFGDWRKMLVAELEGAVPSEM